MTGEPFLARWSRLKREPEPSPPAETAVPTVEPAHLAKEPLVLSSLEELGSDSDYTAFLRDGVPEELRRLALRKAWASDPKIAGFRGFADYDWDYNAPGYGALLPTDDVAGLLDRLLPAQSPPPEARPETAPEPPPEALVATAEPEETPLPDDPDRIT